MLAVYVFRKDDPTRLVGVIHLDNGKTVHDAWRVVDVVLPDDKGNIILRGQGHVDYAWRPARRGENGTQKLKQDA